MCRKAGRRCPSHTEPEAIEERNEVRREQYAAKVLRDKTAEFLAESGVKFARGDAVKDIYFQGKEEFDLNKFEPVQDQFQDDYLVEVMPNHFWSKPQGGGLWTAPGINEEDKVKTAWTDWSVENDFHVNNNPVTPIRVKKQAVVVIIDSEEDLQALCKAYPKGNSFSFEDMSKAGIDGLRLSDKGHNEARKYNTDNKIHNFSIWDMDSTVWLNKDNLIGGKPLPQGEYATNDRDEDDRRPWEDESEAEEPIQDWDDLMAELEESSKQEVVYDEKEIAATRLRMKLQGM